MSYSPSRGLAVQVAECGRIYTSGNLLAWLPRESGTTHSLRAVTFLGSRLLITGERGTVLYSDSDPEFHAGTLLDGPTDDWLEAVAASPSLAVAVGDRGAVYTSPDGIEWNRQNAGFSDWLRGVAYGDGVFVAVGETGRIATSPDGTNWMARLSGTGAHLNRVAHSAGRFTVVGNDGVTLFSTNGGILWLSDPTGASRNLFHTAQAGDERVAVGNEEVRLFEGGSWSNELDKEAGPPPWTYLANIGWPDFFMIAGRTGMVVEGYQTNGEPYFWIESAPSVRNWLFDVFRTPELYVAVGDRATVMTSRDGIDWELEVVPEAVTNSIFLGLGGTTNLLVAAGNAGSLMVSPNDEVEIVTTNESGMTITQMVSTLGVVWHAVEPRPTSNDLQGVTSFGGTHLVSGGLGEVLSSPDGTNWVVHQTPSSAFLSGLAAHPGGVIASGDDGALLSSPDGTNWTLRTSGTANWLYRVRHAGDVLMAVGQEGTILTSSDGIDWEPRVSNTTSWLNDVVYIDGAWYVVGNQGAVLSSTNLVDWHSVGTITRKSLSAAATDGALLVAAGIEGVILRSRVVPDLTPITILDYARTLSGDGENYQSLHLFGGQPDQRFTLDSRAGLMTNEWQTGTMLEFRDSSGTLLYLENIPAAESPPEEYYRATLVP
ncbi:MAG TPA: hypothetical protein VMS21_08640 [Methylomirabilota bacterium]|nr:hypothetical protein [Methylomirabilota bacterium]